MQSDIILFGNNLFIRLDHSSYSTGIKEKYAHASMNGVIMMTRPFLTYEEIESYAGKNYKMLKGFNDFIELSKYIAEDR